MKADIILCVISIALLGVGAYMWRRASRLISIGEKATATVVENRYSYNKNGGYYFPIVKFTTRDNRVILQELDVAQRPAMVEGSVVNVIYDPENPADVTISSSWLLEILPRFLLAAGIAGFILGCLEMLMITDYINAGFKLPWSN